MGKNSQIAQIFFVGQQADEVTGSAVLIKTEKLLILVECGLHQGNESILEQYRINNGRLSYKPKDLDYIVVLHSHIDHVGLIPKLYKMGATCPIIAPKGLKRLFQVMCEDSAFIMERDSEALEKKFHKSFDAIYTTDHVKQALKHWQEYETNCKITITEDFSIKFTGSGHIINACQGEIYLKKGGKSTKVVVTSDLGNTAIAGNYTSTFSPVSHANLLIGEATYSRETKHLSNKHRKKDLEKIQTVIEQFCIERKGKVLFPTFALQRTQVIATLLYNCYKDKENFDIPIYIDSPLAIKVFDIFLEELKQTNIEEYKLLREVSEWKNIHFLKEFAETEKALSSSEPCVFLSCSGMMNAGRSVHIASKLLPNSNNCIVFCGYTTEGTIGGKIKNKKQKTITIEEKNIPCRCQVISLLSFSNHMQRQELLDYYSSGNFDKIAIVHSNFDSKVIFCKELQDLISKKNKTGKVCCVNKSTKITL